MIDREIVVIASANNTASAVASRAVNHDVPSQE